jgi:EmrB/QacA subfamily drug resistance transporter
MESLQVNEETITPDIESDPALALSHRAKIEILIAILLGLFLAALDQTIVGPVLPHIVTDLQGADYYTWVVTIFLVTSTITVPIYGKLSDLYGRRPLLLFGITLFLIGSALSGLSQTMWQLILFRGIQGLGAGALFPIALATIGDLFTPAERGKYQGLFGAVFGIAFLVGPGLGGILTDTFSWHWIFFVNLPIGIIALVVIARLLPNIKSRRRNIKIDYAGVVTLTLGLMPILVGLTLAETSQWTDPAVWGTIVAGAVFLVIFVLVEARAAEPIIPLHLFRNRTFSASMVAIFLATFGFGAAIIFLPLYFQIVQGASATLSGYELLPFLAGLIVASIGSGIIVSRTGKYKTIVVAGLAILAIGLYLMSQLRFDTPNVVLWGWMFVAGFGVGPTFAVFTIIVQNAVPYSELGAATADLTLFRQIGTTMGLTLAFTFFRDNLTWGLLHDQIVLAGAPPSIVPTSPPPGFDLSSLTSVTSTGNPLDFVTKLPADVQGFFITGFHAAFTLAIANSMLLGVGAAGAAVLVSLLLKEIPLRTSTGAQVAEVKANPDAANPNAAVPTRRVATD